MNTHDLNLIIEGVSKSFSSGEHLVLADINLQIPRGQFVAVVGPSGCGKTTLLNLILGTEKPTSGTQRIRTGSTDRWQEIEGHGKDRGIVYQNYPLFKSIKVIHQVALGLVLTNSTIPRRMLKRLTRVWKGEYQSYLDKAEQLLIRFGLGDDLLKYPYQLSGGMKQRVAIARSLIMEPEILLMDEPFGAQDVENREAAQDILRDLYRENIKAMHEGRKPPYTVILVTHSLMEAVRVGDRVIGLGKKWDWQAQGYTRHPGATIIYDKAAPYYETDDTTEAGLLLQQSEELERILFQTADLNPTTHRTFWDEEDARNKHTHGPTGVVKP